MVCSKESVRVVGRGIMDGILKLGGVFAGRYYVQKDWPMNAFS